ncbi:Uncharacterised protein [Chlamydia trachomatis]|nr:Uncharacterised protein [Chlamydia trachomatis]
MTFSGLSILVVDWVNLCILQSSQGICSNRQARHTATECTIDFPIVQSHLNGLVRILIMHVVDDVQSLNVGFGKPFQSLLVICLNLLVVKSSISFWLDWVNNTLINNLHASHFIAATVDSVEQSLCGVNASSEELHLLTNAHWGNAASNSSVIAPVLTNIFIGLVLNCRSVDRDLCAETLVGFWKLWIPENSDVWLRTWPKMLKSQSVEQTERSLSNKGATIIAEASIGPSCPVWISREDCVVILSTQEAHNTKLHNQSINDFLSIGFVD